jgi:Fur family ferric uptake transcriptional regulator
MAKWAAIADPLAQKLRTEQGFEIDAAHFAIFGRCADCLAGGAGRPQQHSTPE